ncbi:hypothetical protein CP970_26380 [Streptomyces kanamyceticus]|uniref:Uncharacterized protein n=1 Tax=Streptomyces kanamyceticus TaxID=1967 RepID=A0A5J6GQM0_STRKN|nr:hypothetical protein CP970_26380 [Streptomyces kanamyceticus]
MRVIERARFASMPTRTPAHTFGVNSMSGMWDMFHLIRLFSQAKGLCTRRTGHMAQQPALKHRRLSL